MSAARSHTAAELSVLGGFMMGMQMSGRML